MSYIEMCGMKRKGTGNTSCYLNILNENLIHICDSRHHHIDGCNLLYIDYNGFSFVGSVSNNNLDTEIDVDESGCLIITSIDFETVYIPPVNDDDDDYYDDDDTYYDEDE